MKPKSTSDKKPGVSKAEPYDLKEELQEELKVQFSNNLKATGLLSEEVCDSLTTLLNSEALTSADLLSKLREDSSNEGEAKDE